MTDRIATEGELIARSDGAFYVFDTNVLRDRIAKLRAYLPGEIGLCYAVKANTFIIADAEPLVDRLEVCSPGEARICRRLGADSRKMVISGVYKTPEVIADMISDVDFNGIFTAESLRQYEMICYHSKRCGRSVPVLLRLTNDSQFGMDDSVIDRVIAGRDAHPEVEILGIQYFSGTQKTSIKKLKRELEHLDKYLLHLREDYGYTAGELEYGTGFPVSYFTCDEIDEEELIRGFVELVRNMQARPRLTIELGRSIAASCGSYYTRVVDAKHNRGLDYLIVDGGMHHLTYFGQQMAMKQPYMYVAGKKDFAATESYNICGSICSMNDIIVKQMPLPGVEVGDVLCFENTGAYCATEGISLFLSRDLPQVYLRGADGMYTLVREKYETADLNTPRL